jgi:voltage-gated potassium channel
MAAKKLKIKNWQFILALSTVIGCLVLGTVGLHVIEKLSWLDSVYLIVQIISTVGLDRVQKISPTGRLFIIFFVLIFMTFFTIALSLLMREMVNGRLREEIIRRWREKRAHKMQNHFIVCGHGRLGAQILSELQAEGRQAVVIEQDREIVDQLALGNSPVILGDATEDSILESAGIRQANGLLAALPDDADNVFITLTARQLNPTIRVITRANHEKTRNKLLRAGANRVVLPAEMGGKRMAYALIRPVVADFIDIVTGDQNHDLKLEQWNIPEGCDLIGKTVKDIQFRTRFGISVLGLAPAGGRVQLASSHDVLLNAGDTLVLLGSEESLAALDTLGLPA